MNTIKKIGIIGGGPAGSYAAWLLQQKGFQCTIFDHKIPFEKACGGGITSKAFASFDILNDCEKKMQVVRSFQIISPKNKTVTLQNDATLHIVSRKTLSEYMLQKCLDSGVQHIAEKVVGCDRKNNQFTITTDKEYTGFDFVLGADGANGVSRNLFGAEAFNKNRLGAMGYYIDGLTDQKIIIKFYADFQGYLWMFPRPGHASVGVGFPSGSCNKKKVLEMVTAFLAEYYPQFHPDENHSYAATIPFVADWKKENLQGDGWALLGDAGGFTDVITGEGIYYAFKSAELFVQCMVAEKPENYFSASAQVRNELQKSYQLMPRFYQKKTLELLVSMCRRSAFVRKLSAQLIIGNQSYLTLKKYLKKHLPTILLQMVFGNAFSKK